ncbi:hypothetical protein [Methanobacterium sp. ACI-7]|uniref:hypothetical protein n=1 Tax=unclassified Methanobacterium TaxID=2627676 RepID=UPI0039C0990A
MKIKKLFTSFLKHLSTPSEVPLWFEEEFLESKAEKSIKKILKLKRKGNNGN